MTLRAHARAAAARCSLGNKPFLNESVYSTGDDVVVLPALPADTAKVPSALGKAAAVPLGGTTSNFRRSARGEIIPILRRRRVAEKPLDARDDDTF